MIRLQTVDWGSKRQHNNSAADCDREAFAHLSAGRATSDADQERRLHLGRGAAVAGRFRQAIAVMQVVRAHSLCRVDGGLGCA